MIEEADVLIGAGRMLRAFSHLGKPSFESWKADEIKAYIQSGSFETAAVLMSGDCGFYSGCEKLLHALEDYDTEVICGISSPVYFCSRIKLPWQDMAFRSLHGESCNVIRTVCMNEYSFFLLGGKITPCDVCRKLCEYGMDSVKVYIGENLSYENEKISSGCASDFLSGEFSGLSVIVVHNPSYEKSLRTGIADSEFIRGKVPMTKSEIRSIVISKLGIDKNGICWDAGCGTGSVSVEMAFQAYEGMVFAADKNDEAVLLTKENCRRFRTDNVSVISGEAPSCFENIPAPDYVFIGGSCGRMHGIISLALSKNPSAVIVITAVSLETLTDAVNSMEKCGISSPEIIQAAVTRTKKLGSHTMLSAENPVFIIKGAAE